METLAFFLVISGTLGKLLRKASDWMREVERESDMEIESIEEGHAFGKFRIIADMWVVSIRDNDR